VPKKKKPAHKSAPKAKKKVVRAKKVAPKKKPLRTKKPVGKKSPAREAVVESFEVELVGSSGNLFEDEEETGEEDFPQEYGGSE
jgi:hypothetical protein